MLCFAIENKIYSENANIPSNESENQKVKKGSSYPTPLVIAITTSREIVILAIKWLLLKDKTTHDKLRKINCDITLD